MTVLFEAPARHEALSRLTDRRLLRELAYIDGRWRAGARTFPVVDPASGKTLAHVAALGAADADKAIAAAAASFPTWKCRRPQERAAVLRGWGEAMLTHRDDLALLMTLEQGKPLAEARGEIDYAASFLEWFAEEGKRLGAEMAVSPFADAETVVRREPLGVAAVVTPWNFPSAMLTRKAGAALAAGCTVVAHPSSETPLSALALAELGERAGLPAGVFNVVTGDAAAIVGRLCASEQVVALSFTGSTKIGRRLASLCAPTLKRLVLELGGHAPVLVFEDADLARAVDIAMAAKFATSGQDCLAANRIYVQRAIYPAFCEAFARRISNLKVGPGLEPGVEIGPLIHAKAVAKVEAQIADAVERGARVLTGGAGASAGPSFLAPTLIADAPDDALVMCEETFGPLAAATPFDSEEEVVRRANASDYGLVAYVVTRDGARQLRLARALDYGMIAVNRVKITGAPIPFGGWKQSGLGREGSRYGAEAFTELKYLCLDIN